LRRLALVGYQRRQEAPFSNVSPRPREGKGFWPRKALRHPRSHHATAGLPSARTATSQRLLLTDRWGSSGSSPHRCSGSLPLHLEETLEADGLLIVLGSLRIPPGPRQLRTVTRSSIRLASPGRPPPGDRPIKIPIAARPSNVNGAEAISIQNVLFVSATAGLGFAPACGRWLLPRLSRRLI